MAAAPVLADVHYLYAGYFDEAYISGIEFDDAANTLNLVNNYSVTSGSSRWIAADVSRKSTAFNSHLRLLSRPHFDGQPPDK